jgi:hypothetical protein
VLYTGQILREANTLINVSVNGKPPAEIRLAGGTALNTVPWSNEEARIPASPPARAPYRTAR